MERTLVLLKPDCVQRRLMGRVLARFEDKGLNIIAMKMMRVTPGLAKQHYAEHVKKSWYPALEGFITGGPIVAAVVEGLDGSASLWLAEVHEALVELGENVPDAYRAAARGNARPRLELAEELERLRFMLGV